MYRLTHRAFVGLAVLAAVPAMAQAPQVLTSGIESLAQQVTEQVGRHQSKRTLAVFPLRMQDGTHTLFGRYVADELRIHIARERVLTVVERDPENLERLLEEMEVGRSSGYFEPSTVRELGRLTGADTIVTGTVTDLNSMVAVNVRLIDTQTGSMLGAALVKIVKDVDVTTIFPGAVVKGPVGPERHERNTPPSVERSAREVQKSGSIKLELVDCRSMADGVRCNFSISSVGRDAQLYTIQGRVVDLGGLEIELSEFGIGGKQQYTILPSDVPMKLEMVFRSGGRRSLRAHLGGSKEEVVVEDRLALLEVDVNNSDFRFRGVQLAE